MSLNFLVGMLYTQAFQELYYQADKVHMGGLPVPVRLMFDEFANVALPDGYARLQATMRSRNIMATIILQNISQLKALFKDDWEGIIGNADTMIYLGGNEQSTHKYISEQLGKETIITTSSSQGKGKNGSFSQSTQQTGRELMTPDEVRLLDNKNAIVFIRRMLSIPRTAEPPLTSTARIVSMICGIFYLHWRKLNEKIYVQARKTLFLSLEYADGLRHHAHHRRLCNHCRSDHRGQQSVRLHLFRDQGRRRHYPRLGHCAGGYVHPEP